METPFDVVDRLQRQRDQAERDVRRLRSLLHTVERFQHTAEAERDEARYWARHYYRLAHDINELSWSFINDKDRSDFTIDTRWNSAANTPLCPICGNELVNGRCIIQSHAPNRVVT